jgi:hypothetical protein
MTEELLHFIWKYRFINSSDLKTTDGDLIEIIHPGTHNTDAGPDFFNAKVKIGDTLWAGNVEMHLKASDWAHHRHHLDAAYNNVILHVVLNDDVDVFTEKGIKVPMMKLEVIESLQHKYIELLLSEKWLVCQDALSQLNNIDWHGWLDRCLISRFEERTAKILSLLDQFNGDWEQVFFIVIARSFGFGTNSQPFEMMARQTPVRALLHHADNLLQVEAILFGQAGFIGQEPQNEYQTLLAREYGYLASKFNLKPIPVHLWKFLRLRPVNFPTIRIAQLAAFINQNGGAFESLINQHDIHAVIDLLDLQASTYWNTHYQLFEDESENHPKALGVSSRQLILINAIIPMMYAYGQHRSNDDLMAKAFDWLSKLPPEKNHIVDGWQLNGGIEAVNAYESQSLVHLRTAFCEQKKCLQCRIGLLHLKKSIEPA